MKKKVFFAVMFILFWVVVYVTPKAELGYDYPPDEGVNKLFAGILAVVLSLWGAVSGRKRIAWIYMCSLPVMLFSFGVSAAFAYVVMALFSFIMVDGDENLKDFLLTPFKEED